MKNWEKQFSKGKQRLADRQVRGALECFHQAMKDCPVSEREEFCRILFYLGICFHKLGYLASALECWLAASRLGRHRSSQVMLKRLSNGYGMPKGFQGSLEDDFRAFRMIQLSKYLSSRRQGRFGSPAEKDMVMDLIEAAWNELRSRVCFAEFSIEEKKSLFAAEVIIFPYLETPCQWLRPFEGTVLPFTGENSRFLFKKACPCGSGKLFGQCCGQILGEDELFSGIF